MIKLALELIVLDTKGTEERKEKEGKGKRIALATYHKRRGTVDAGGRLRILSRSEIAVRTIISDQTWVSTVYR